MSPRSIKLGLLSLTVGAFAAPFRPTGTGMDYPDGNNTFCDLAAATGTAGHAHHRACMHFRHHNGTDVAPVATDYTTVTEIITVDVTPVPAAAATGSAAQSEEALSIASTSSSTPSSIPASTPSSTPLSTPIESTVTESNAAATAAATAPQNVASVPASYSTSVTTSVPPAPATTSSTAVAPVTTSAAAPASSVSAASSSSSGSKKGIAFTDASFIQAFSGADMSFAYNWASSHQGTIPSNIEYVPLLWGNTQSFTSTWQTNAQNAINSGSTHLMCFNEPDLDTQSNIDPQTAATDYKQYMSGMFGGKDIKLGAPAVTNGGGTMGLTWLQNFLDACTDCQIDFVPIHWYDSATNIQYFQQHLEQAYNISGKPVWLTEYGASGSDSQIETFLQTVNPWMDQQPWIERYSYFLAGTGSGYLCSSDTELSDIGQAYVQSS